MFDPRTKDNLTDLATEIGNGSNSDDSSNLADNQVVGSDGQVIDLGNSSENTVNK